MKEIKAAIIGASYALNVIVPSLKKIKKIKIIGIYSPNIRKKETDIYKFSKLKEIYASNFDFLIIATPPNIQFKILNQLIHLPKMIMIEKPLCGPKVSNKKIYFLNTRLKDTKTLVDFSFARHPVFKFLKKFTIDNELTIKNKIIIKWHYISYNNKNSIKSWKASMSNGGGVFYNIFIHLAYLLEWTFGEFNFINDINKNKILNDKLKLKLELTDHNNLPVDVSINSNSKKFLFYFKIMTSKGLLEIYNTSGDHFGIFTVSLNKEKIKTFKTNKKFIDQRSNYVLDLIDSFISDRNDTANIQQLANLQIKMNNFIRQYEKKI